MANFQSVHTYSKLDNIPIGVFITRELRYTITYQQPLKTYLVITINSN